MRHTFSLLLSAALAASAGLACAQVDRGAQTNPDRGNLDGTGAGVNAGVAGDSRVAPRPDATGNGRPAARVEGSADTRVQGAGPSARDPTPTVGINGTGTLDGSVPENGGKLPGGGVSGSTGASGGLPGGVQR